MCVHVCVCVCVCAHTQSHLTLCNPMNCSPPGFSVHRMLQERTLEWVAIYSSRGSSRPTYQTHVSCIHCIGRWILYHCLTWEAILSLYIHTCIYIHIYIFLLKIQSIFFSTLVEMVFNFKLKFNLQCCQFPVCRKVVQLYECV